MGGVGVMSGGVQNGRGTGTSSGETPPVARREIFGWCCFDFANSSFTTIVITVVYAVYFNAGVAGGAAWADAWWGRALALSQVVVIAVSPWLGAVGDFTARKKRYLMGTAVTCSLFTALLILPGKGDVWSALSLVVVANIAFSLSENLCASFLPEISTPKTVGRISGYGWSFGYVGGLLSLVLALAIIRSGADARWTMVMTGVFFMVACLPTLAWLRERAVPKPLPAGKSYLSLGWGEVFRTVRDVSKFRVLAVFFVAFTLFMSGLCAVVTFAALFSAKVLAMTQEENILLFALLQVTSALGAFGFGYFQDRFGAKETLVISLLLWIGVSIWGAVCATKGEFFALGLVAGLGIGSLQSSSRAVVSMLAPPERSGEFFGFWGLFGKLGGVIGPLLMGQLASSIGYRRAIIYNGLFFLGGLAILVFLPLGKKKAPV